MIKLSDIADAIDLQHDDEYVGYYDRETEQIVFLSTMEDFNIDSEDLADAPSWRQEVAEQQRLIEEDDEKARRDESTPRRFLQLPSQFDVNEYRVMERFSEEQTEPNAGRLLDAIRGRGAFRRFKDLVWDMELREAWFAYKQRHLLELAKDFCEGNGIGYEES